MEIPFLKKFKKKSKIPEELFPKEPFGIADIIAPSSLEVKQNYLKLGERFAKSYFIFSYPRYLSTGWLSPIINLNVPMDISFYLHPISSESILRKLRKRVTEVQAEISEREEKGLIRDPALETAYQDLEDLRDKLQTAQERMFRFSLYLTVYANTEKELRDIETNLRSILESRLIYIKPALYQQKEGFICTSPYNLDKLMVTTLMNTAPLSSTFPFISFDLSSNEGILYGINKHNNSLVLFDRFSLANANEVIFATSGAGKSVVSSTPVLVKTNKKIQLTKIGPLIEKTIKEKGLTQIDEELKGTIDPKIEVFSFNKDLKGEWSKVSVAARKKAPKLFYKFKTKSGREITTTGDHNMLILKNGKVIAAKSSEIKQGEYIPLPREVSVNQKPLTHLNLLTLLKNSKRVYVINAGNILKRNYEVLKKTVLDEKYDRYLYKYRDGRPMPIQYFLEILDFLKIKPNNFELKNLKITSRNGKNRHLLPIDFPITSALLKTLGFIAAEGTTRNEVIMISNTDPEFLQSAQAAFKDIDIPFFYGNRGINTASRVFIDMIKALEGFGKSGEKRICPFVFNLDKTKIAQYLSAYFEGDGGVEKHEIAAVSKSKGLISEISYLLYYFGIVSRISKTKKRAQGWVWKKTYWTLSISGQDNLRKFAKHIGFISKRKKNRLEQIIKKEGNTNVDLIPEVAPIIQEIYHLFSSQLHDIREISSLKLKSYKPSPLQLQKVINKIEERIQHFKNLRATFETLNKLPNLAQIINIGKENEQLNSALWQILGNSWQVMKNQKSKPFSQNAFKSIKIINGSDYSLVDLKEKINLGFKEMDIPMKYYNHSLQSALVARKKSNTSYETIQKSAQFVWQNYQDVLMNKIPLVEKKLAQLKVLANSNLFWDPIVEIEKIENKNDKYVYDLTVDNEVFLAGQGGMFVHNSYAVKLEILRYLMLGAECIIIDPENEYKFLAEAVGGSFFNISLSSEHHINPFDLPPPREDEKPEDVLRSNIINLVGLMRVMLGGLTPEEDGIIDRALTETYAAKDITPETDPKLWGKKESLPFPTMSDLEAILETMEGAESLVKRLQRFTKGVYSQFFNQPSNVSMENRLVVFGIRDMEDELRPMALFMILRYIWKTITSEMKKRLLVIDEAWWLMKTEDGASFLFGTVKRARKYWLGVTTITQDVQDFMKSEYGKPILTNSSLALLMKQSPATINVVQKTFNLTEEEKMSLLESPVGEGIFFAGTKHVLIKILASYTEDQIITTSPEQLQKIKQAKKEIGS